MNIIQFIQLQTTAQSVDAQIALLWPFCFDALSNDYRKWIISLSLYRSYPSLPRLIENFAVVRFSDAFGDSQLCCLVVCENIIVQKEGRQDDSGCDDHILTSCFIISGKIEEIQYQQWRPFQNGGLIWGVINFSHMHIHGNPESFQQDLLTEWVWTKSEQVPKKEKKF